MTDYQNYSLARITKVKGNTFIIQCPFQRIQPQVFLKIPIYRTHIRKSSRSYVKPWLAKLLHFTLYSLSCIFVMQNMFHCMHFGFMLSDTMPGIRLTWVCTFHFLC